jgi:hypothetical protein
MSEACSAHREERRIKSFDKIGKKEMGKAFSAHAEERRIQGFGGET